MTTPDDDHGHLPEQTGDSQDEAWIREGKNVVLRPMPP